MIVYFAVAFGIGGADMGMIRRNLDREARRPEGRTERKGMTGSLFQVTLVVRDYAEALDFFCERLGFVCHEDTALGDGKRWIVVGPPDGPGARLLLARAAGERTGAGRRPPGGWPRRLFPGDRRISRPITAA